MNRSAEERIAQLLAQGHAHRLATQLAIHEARVQLAPLRTVAAFVGAVAGVVSRSSATSGVTHALKRFGVGHPWATSTLAMVAFRLLRGRPLATLAAAAAGAVTWWMLRRWRRAPEAERPDDIGNAAQASG